MRLAQCLRRWPAVLAGFATLAVALLPALEPASAALADGGPQLTSAGRAFSSGTTVYVDPNATDVLTSAEVAHLEALIRNGSHAIFIGVFSTLIEREVGGNPNHMPAALHAATNLAGVYVGWAAGAIRADATESAGVPQAGSIASTAYLKHGKQGAYPTLLYFVQQVEALPEAANSVTKSPPFPTGEVILGVVVAVGLVVAVIFFVRRRRRQATETNRTANTGARLRSRIETLEQKITAFEPVGNAATAQLQIALNKCGDARTALGHADTVDDFDTVRSLYDEAQTAFAEAQRLSGAGHHS